MKGGQGTEGKGRKKGERKEEQGREREGKEDLMNVGRLWACSISLFISEKTASVIFLQTKSKIVTLRAVKAHLHHTQTHLRQ